jgi:hypothetical protein
VWKRTSHSGVMQTLHYALTSKRLGGIMLPVLCRSVDTAALFIEDDHVEVDLSPGVVISESLYVALLDHDV